MPTPPRWLLVVVELLVWLGFLEVSVLGWGDWPGFLAHPVRLALVVAGSVFTLATGIAGVHFSTGRREDAGNRWILLPGTLVAIAMYWVSAFTDRRDILTVDGDTVRYLGLFVFVLGGVLRVWPMFVLGHRFSALVAIQENHQLATGGLYRVIRHPSYLGGLVALVGWALVFRSVLGLVLMLPFVWITVSRMDAEEALLASEFGVQYAAYRGRTWRLIPGIY